MQQRQTAYKLWISDIINGKFYKGQEEFDPGYIVYNDKNISRTNILATVIDVFKNDDGSYAVITLDDNSATIKVKTFGQDTNIINDIKKGDLVLIVGKIKEYQDEIYILPELIKKLDNINWDLLRKVELIKTNGKSNKRSMKEDIISPTKNMLFKIINEKGDSGINLEEIKENINVSDEELKSLLNKLVEDGEIYQDRPNNYRII